MGRSQTIDILVPVFNGRLAVQACLKSLLRHTEPWQRILVLDDASTDIRLLTWLSRLERDYPQIHVLGINENLGFVGNVNRGLKLSDRDIVVLNSDTRVTPGWLDRLLACRDSDSAIGIVCPLSNNATLLSVPVMQSNNQLPVGAERAFARLLESISRRSYPRLPVAVGFCMLITRNLIRAIGLLHEAFEVGYGEECDFSLRAWRAGFQIVCADDSFIYHQGEASFGVRTDLEHIRQANRTTLLERWPQYERAVSRWCQRNPLRELQECIYTHLVSEATASHPHVLQVIHSYEHLGGTELHTQDIVQYLSKTHRISLLYPSNIADLWLDILIEQQSTQRLLRYNRTNIDYSMKLLDQPLGLANDIVDRGFARLLRGGDYRLVHFQHLVGWGSLQLPLIASAMGLPILLSLHDYYLLCPVYDLVMPEAKRCLKVRANPLDPDCINCLRNQISRQEDTLDIPAYLAQRNTLIDRIIKVADRLIAPSVHVRDRFIRAFGSVVAEKVSLVPHGVSRYKIAKRKHRQPQKVIRIGVLVNLSQRKGADILLEILRQTADAALEFHHFGGVATELLEPLDARSLIRHGTYSRSELPDRLRDIDLVLIPSIFEETFCLTAAEALSAGVPVIAFKAGALAERIIDGINGFLVKEINAGSMARKLMELHENPKCLLKIRRYLQINRQKSRRENACDYSRLYRKLIQQSRYKIKPVDPPLLGLDSSKQSTVETVQLLELEKDSTGDLGIDYGSAIYQKWLALARKASPSIPKSFSMVNRSLAILVVIDCRDASSRSMRRTWRSLSRQQYDNWHLLLIEKEGAVHRPRKNITRLYMKPGEVFARMVNHAITGLRCNWIALIRAGDCLSSTALESCIEALQNNPHWRMVYSDEDRIAEDSGRYAPLFKPDSNPDLLRSMPYVGSWCMIERSTFLAVGGLAPYPGSEIYDLALKTLDYKGESAIGHLAEVIYHRADNLLNDNFRGTIEYQDIKILQQHLQRRRWHGSIHRTGHSRVYWIDYQTDDRPLVSVLLPVAKLTAELQLCLSELLTHNYSPIEILVLLNGAKPRRLPEKIVEILKDDRIRLLIHHGVRSIAAGYNFAAKKSRGEFLWLLDDGLLPASPDTLRLLVGLCSRPDTAVAAPYILSTHGIILSSYYILGAGSLGIAAQAHGGSSLGTAAYMNRNLTLQRCSAVSSRAMLIKKAVFDKVGGFDGMNFPHYYSSLDLCLKLGKQDNHILSTPHATVIAASGDGSLTRHSQAKVNPAQIGVEAVTILDHWLDQLAEDPAYNRNMSLQQALWQPEVRSVCPWTGVRPDGPMRVLGFPDNEWGSGHYRIKDPLRALHNEGLVRYGWLSASPGTKVPNITELKRMDPDHLVLHNALHDQHLYALELYARYSKAQRIFSLDDLVTDLPKDNPFRLTNYTDMADRLERAISYCDRLVVSTEALADAYQEMGRDIRVIPNYLDQRRWLGLAGKRRPGKPRIGWAGAMQHQHDLEWLEPVVAALHKEADWIFFGMCPAALRPYAHETVPMIDFSDYPSKLAMLGLDVALAPLQDNPFNRCKSNLRLLEYGILGYPVICTDLEPYRDAPVTRLPNDPQLWINALRARIYDVEAAKEEGANLKQWVTDNWLLQDHLDRWLDVLQNG